jgi:hypothetical protein
MPLFFSKYKYLRTSTPTRLLVHPRDITPPPLEGYEPTSTPAHCASDILGACPEDRAIDFRISEVTVHVWLLTVTPSTTKRIMLFIRKINLKK